MTNFFFDLSFYLLAKKLCPQLVIVPTNFSKYKAVSKDVQDIFREYDPNFAPMSLDEAYLNITNYLESHTIDFEEDSDKSFAEQVVEEIRSKIEKKTQLTASAGIYYFPIHILFC